MTSPSATDVSAAPAAAPRRRFSVGGLFARWEWAALGGILVLYLVVVALSVRRGPPLGWDESVYSLRARDFATGTEPVSYWDAYRAPGLPWVLHFLWGLGSHPTVFRLAVAAFMLGLVVVTWLLTRHLFGRGPALVAAAGVSLSPPLLLAATQVWPDVPGAALGLLAIALFVIATGGDRPSWWMAALVPVVAAATFVRYGAPLPMAVGLLAVAGWRWRVWWRRPLPVIVTALAAAAVVVTILAVPQLSGAQSSPLRAITGYNRSWLDGFAGFASMGEQAVGPAAVVLALAGVVAGFGWAKREGIDRSALVVAGVVCVVTVVGLATVLHGELRYLAPAYPWLWVAGAPGLERLGRALPRRAQPVLAAVVVLALAVAGVGTARERNRAGSSDHGSVRQAATEIAAQAGGRRCLVVVQRVPQVMWYSGCKAIPFDLDEIALDEIALPRPPRTVTFLMWVGGDERQPTGDLLAAYRAAAGELILSLEDRRPVEVYLVHEPRRG